MKTLSVFLLVIAVAFFCAEPAFGQNSIRYLGKAGTPSALGTQSSKDGKAFPYYNAIGAVYTEVFSTWEHDSLDLFLKATYKVKIDSIAIARRAQSGTAHGTHREIIFRATSDTTESSSYASWTSTAVGASKYFSLDPSYGELGPLAQLVIYFASAGNPTVSKADSNILVSVVSRKRGANKLLYLPKSTNTTWTSFDGPDDKWFVYNNSSGTVYTAAFETAGYDSLDIMIETEDTVKITSVKVTRLAHGGAATREVISTSAGSVVALAGVAKYLSFAPANGELGPFAELQLVFDNDENPVVGNVQEMLISVIGRRRK